jgi:alpha-L-rhamnosidase
MHSFIMRIACLAALGLLATCSSILESGPDAPTGLLCDLLRAPEQAVITDANPEFGWIVSNAQDAAIQSAYQILVASSPDFLHEDTADMWSTGKIHSAQSINVEYTGTQLQPNTTYWWMVRTWDANGNTSPYSRPQQFRTGLFDDAKRQWPGESKWRQQSDGDWLLENRQRAAYQDISPQLVQEIAPGHFVADFGRAAFGTLRFTATSPDNNHKLTLYLGERSNADGTVNKEPGKSNIGFHKEEMQLQQGTHTYTLELPRHRSGYHNHQVLADHMPEVLPYRYVEFVDCPSTMKTSDMQQVALYYYFDDDAASFECSDERLNQVWELCKYTLKATPFLALYADGNRERMPYEADAYIQQLGHYAVDREFSVARYTNQFLIYNSSWPTEWHLHTVLMAWADYLHTGNKESLEQYYEDLQVKTLVDLARLDGLISTTMGQLTSDLLKRLHFTGKNFRDIVDWPAGTPAGKQQGRVAGPTPAGERDSYDFRPINTVVNAFHYRSLVLMAEIASALGKQQDVTFYETRARMVKTAFNDKLLDKQRGIYVDGEGSDHAALHANMFPLAFGITPEPYVESVARHIQSRGMACSVYGAQYLLESLYLSGAAQHALDLMTSDSKRSWLNMLRVGSTMTTEAWDEYYKPNLTWNHAWGSAPANIIARYLMGIRPLEPGFGTVVIQPQLASLTDARMKLPTIRGPVSLHVSNEENQPYIMKVGIPANMTARIMVPIQENTTPDILLDGTQAPGTVQGKYLVLDDIGSGHHVIERHP